MLIGTPIEVWNGPATPVPTDPSKAIYLFKHNSSGGVVTLVHDDPTFTDCTDTVHCAQPWLFVWDNYQEISQGSSPWIFADFITYGLKRWYRKTAAPSIKCRISGYDDSAETITIDGTAETVTNFHSIWELF